jgi:16S rRNA (guanine527-N7)-methyltransferase
MQKGPHITDAEIREVLLPYGVEASAELCGHLRIYIGLLLHWNKAVSLTTITDPVEIVQRHFGESFFATAAVPITEGRLADVGSGAGFPGAAIAMVAPRVSVTLIESNARKAAFLETVRAELKLSNLEVVKVRAQDAAQMFAASDFITARALGDYDRLLRLLRRSAKGSASVVLWLGEDDAHALGRTEGWGWRPTVKIPGSQKRVLLVGSKQSARST